MSGISIIKQYREYSITIRKSDNIVNSYFSGQNFTCYLRYVTASLDFITKADTAEQYHVISTKGRLNRLTDLV